MLDRESPPPTLFTEMPSSPALWIVPPVTVSLPVEPVLLRRTPFVPPLDDMCWNVTPAAAMSVSEMLSARLLAPSAVESIVLPVVPTCRVPDVVAFRPLPLVVSMSVPPPERTNVWPSLFEKVTASLAPVLYCFVAPEKTVEPPVLFATFTPPPASFVSFMLPDRLTTPPVRPVTSAASGPLPLLNVPG